ncbi:MAG: DJ-1/PfpI family protein [Thermodesulfobacteriota bacterium]
MTRAGKAEKKVLLLLAQGFEELEASVFTDVMGWSRVAGETAVGVTACGLRRRIECTWNFTVLPERLVHEVSVRDYDALAIPGGYEEAHFYEDAFHEDFLALIRDFHTAGKWIAAVCVGALPVAKSGVLRDRPATTYGLLGGIRRRQLAELGARVQDRPLVEDGRVITCAGPAQALDTAFLLLERLSSAENVLKVKTAMGFGG